MDPNRPYLVGTAKAAASSRYASASMETSASLSAAIRELAYVRRHPIEGRTPVAFRTRLSRPAGPASTGKSVTATGPSGGLGAGGINGQAALGGLGPGPGGGNAGGEEAARGANPQEKAREVGPPNLLQNPCRPSGGQAPHRLPQVPAAGRVHFAVHVAEQVAYLQKAARGPSASPLKAVRAAGV